MLCELDGLVDHDFDGNLFEREQLGRAQPQDIAIDARHALDTPVLGRARDQLVNLDSARARGFYELARELLRVRIDLELEDVGPADGCPGDVLGCRRST